MYLSEDDISTTCLYNGVLARSLTQFVFIALFFSLFDDNEKKNEEKKKMHEPSTEGRARIRAPIPFDRYQKKGLMAGEQ